jgi:hypothetical protein
LLLPDFHHLLVARGAAVAEPRTMAALGDGALSSGRRSREQALSAILTFSDRVLYPSYSVVPRLFGLSALEDQAAAGAIMWVVGSFAFVVPAAVIAVQCLSRKPARAEPAAARKRDKSFEEGPLPVSPTIPLVHRFRGARLTARTLEAVWFAALFAASGLCFAWFLSSSSDDDDQTLRFQGTSGSFAVAVFTTSGDLAVGTAPFSVLVQDQNTREVLLDAKVDLRAHPAAGLSAPTATALASHATSENKLLQTAGLNLSAAGDWALTVIVRSNSETAEFSLPLHVVKAETAIAFPWPYAAFLTFTAILLLAYLRRHHGPGEYHLQQCSPAVSRNGSS